MAIWSLNKNISGESANPLNPCQKNLGLYAKNLWGLILIGPSKEASWGLYLTLMQKNSDLTLIRHVKKTSRPYLVLLQKTSGISGSGPIRLKPLSKKLWSLNKKNFHGIYSF